MVGGRGWVIVCWFFRGTMSARGSLPKSMGHFELPDWNEDEPLPSDLGADPVGGQGHGS